MTSRKEIKQILKDPDIFQRSMYYSVRWLQLNKAIVGGAIGLLLVGCASFAAWQYFRDSSVNKRQDELASIEYKYQKAGQDADKSKSELRKPIDALSKGDAAKSPVNMAKIAEIELKIAAIKPKYDGLIGEYSAFASKYPKTPESWIAEIRAASLLWDEKKLDEAKSRLESVVNQATKQAQIHSAMANFMLINIAVEQKQFDDAIKRCDNLLKVSPKDMLPQVLMLKAKTLIVKNDKTESTKVLDQIIKDHSAAPEAQRAKTMKSILAKL